MKCFLDLDGVLVDFIGGSCAMHKVVSPWTHPKYMGKWGAEEMFGFTFKDFWLPMGEDFWANLKWTAEGKDILSLVEHIFGYENICILTTPCLTEGSVNGKIKWIEKHVPAYSKKFMIGYQKHFCATSNAILVDDNGQNVKAFRSHGGEAVLVPRPWNSNHDREPLLIPYLTEKLNEYKG